MGLEERYAQAVAALRSLAERRARRYVNVPSSGSAEWSEGYHDGEYSCACEAQEALETLGESVE